MLTWWGDVMRSMLGKQHAESTGDNSFLLSCWPILFPNFQWDPMAFRLDRPSNADSTGFKQVFFASVKGVLHFTIIFSYLMCVCLICCYNSWKRKTWSLIKSHTSLWKVGSEVDHLGVVTLKERQHIWGRSTWTHGIRTSQGSPQEKRCLFSDGDFILQLKQIAGSADRSPDIHSQGLKELALAANATLASRCSGWHRGLSRR